MRRELLRALAQVVAWPLHRDEPRGEEIEAAIAIIVLGAPLDGADRLTEIGEERVMAAAALWRRGGAPLLVVTGGVTRGAGCSEAAAMAAALVALGVPRAAIAIEPHARTTAENARNCARLLRERLGMAPSGLEVWLVTQPYHARRARWYFRRAGLSARAWHIEDSIQYRLQQHAPARVLRWSLREYLAWAKALLLR